MQDLDFTFTGKLWIYAGKGAWHFITLPKEVADGIRFFNANAKGFQPIAVRATIGATTWKTSVFPDSRSGSYMLAVKKDVRKAENIGDGDSVEVRVVVATEVSFVARTG